MSVRIFGTVAVALSFLLLAAASGHAQAPLPPPPPPPSPSAPQPGFVPPYEIMRTVRSAGFDPLAPPLREGTTYVLRATDFRGILMRVVVDANTGAIRAVNRIVPAGPGTYGPGTYGQVGMASQRYGPPDDMLPPYGAPPEFDGAQPPADETGSLPAQPPRVPAAHPVARTKVTIFPPLPRPRPAEIAARKPVDDAKPGIAPADTSSPKPDAQSESKSDARPDVKSGATTSASPAAPIAPIAPKKAPPFPPIND